MMGCVDYFVNLLQITIKSINQDIFIINGYVVEFGKFSKNYSIKGDHLLICISLK